MTAPQLLSRIEKRGGSVTLKRSGDGAAAINVAPCSLALELLPEIKHFKPQLIELLETQQKPATRWSAPALPLVPDVATVRAQLRALDDVLGAAGAARSVVRAHRQIVATMPAPAPQQSQWQRLAAFERHAEAVAVALLDCGIDPATVATAQPDEVSA